MGAGTSDVSAGTRSYSNLPLEILSSIADRLPMIELLGFRGACNDFRSASSTASAEIESFRTPWLLLHKSDSSECVIYNEEEQKTYHRDIPDLKGANCLASYLGWLLLFKDETIFFFCPFSLAKIVLPEFPHKEMDGHVAAFSDVPTSSDCIVSVINCVDETDIAIHTIHKGQSSWTEKRLERCHSLRSSIIAATFDRNSRTFYFMDDDNNLLGHSVKDDKWSPYKIVTGTTSSTTKRMSFCYQSNVFRKRIEDKRDLFNLEDDEFVAVCGLSYEDGNSSLPNVYLNEVVDEAPTKTRVRRAVWIQPRLFEAQPNQQW